MRQIEPYNPLDRLNLGKSVADALLERAPEPLADIEDFLGEGIYALYYAGSFKLYEPISSQNRDGFFEAPIYIGKAVPPGSRKSGGLVREKVSKALIKRLGEHARSIEDSENLDIGDFWCRFLVVEDIWIPLGETLLISKFGPIWNEVVDGFGNHTPGAGRFKQKRSRWDVIHPGRAWAAKCKPREETEDQILSAVKSRLLKPTGS